MLTSRRLRERQAREAAGLPPSPPPQPTEIPYHQHLIAVRDLERAHSAEVNGLRARITELELATKAPPVIEGSAKSEGSAEEPAPRVGKGRPTR